MMVFDADGFDIWDRLDVDQQCLNNRRHMVVCGLMRFRVVDSDMFDVMISASNSNLAQSRLYKWCDVIWYC